MQTVGTATVIATRQVKRMILGRETYNLPEGTTDANAHEMIGRVSRAAHLTWGYAGPESDSTMVVVTVRRLDWKAATARLEAAIAKLERAA